MGSSCARGATRLPKYVCVDFFIQYTIPSHVRPIPSERNGTIEICNLSWLELEFAKGRRTNGMNTQMASNIGRSKWSNMLESASAANGMWRIVSMGKGIVTVGTGKAVCPCR
jgi:hypothetical protein